MVSVKARHSDDLESLSGFIGNRLKHWQNVWASYCLTAVMVSCTVMLY